MATSCTVSCFQYYERACCNAHLPNVTSLGSAASLPSRCQVRWTAQDTYGNRLPPHPSYDAVCWIADPTREGLSTQLITWLRACGARRLVYVSCDVATQARDLQLLCAPTAFDLPATPSSGRWDRRIATLAVSITALRTHDHFPLCRLATKSVHGDQCRALGRACSMHAASSISFCGGTSRRCFVFSRPSKHAAAAETAKRSGMPLHDGHTGSSPPPRDRPFELRWVQARPRACALPSVI